MRRIFFSLLFFFIPFSYCTASAEIVPDKRFVLGLDLGVAETSHLKSVTFPLGYSTFIYTPNRNNYYGAQYGMSLSRRFIPDSLNNIIIGLGYYQFTSIHVKGKIEQGIFPPFYSANYQYTLHLSQLLAEIKLQHQWHHTFYPYFNAKIGGGFHTTRNFNTTVPDYLTVTPTYSNHSSSSLSYALGFGVDTLLSSNVTVGIGYLFSDLGQVGLGNGSIRGRVLPNYLKQSHLYMNTILAQLSWYF